MQIPLKLPALLLLVLALPVAMQAQLNYADNGNSTDAITGCSGGGVVIIPSTTKIPDEI